MSDRLQVLLQYLLPKQRLTTFAGRAAGVKGGSMTTRLIRWFAGEYVRAREKGAWRARCFFCCHSCVCNLSVS